MLNKATFIKEYFHCHAEVHLGYKANPDDYQNQGFPAEPFTEHHTASTGLPSTHSALLS